jgi:hypothetical protein
VPFSDGFGSRCHPLNLTSRLGEIPLLIPRFLRKKEVQSMRVLHAVRIFLGLALLSGALVSLQPGEILAQAERIQ